MIPSTGPNFGIKEQRDFIMDGIFRAMNIEDEDIQCKALETLAEVPPIGYDSIAEYVPRIGDATILFMSKEDTTN